MDLTRVPDHLQSSKSHQNCAEKGAPCQGKVPGPESFNNLNGEPMPREVARDNHRFTPASPGVFGTFSNTYSQKNRGGRPRGKARREAAAPAGKGITCRHRRTCPEPPDPARGPGEAEQVSRYRPASRPNPAQWHGSASLVRDIMPAGAAGMAWLCIARHSGPLRPPGLAGPLKSVLVSARSGLTASAAQKRPFCPHRPPGLAV